MGPSTVDGGCSVHRFSISSMNSLSSYFHIATCPSLVPAAKISARTFHLLTSPCKQHDVITVCNFLFFFTNFFAGRKQCNWCVRCDCRRRCSQDSKRSSLRDQHPTSESQFRPCTARECPSLPKPSLRGQPCHWVLPANKRNCNIILKASAESFQILISI